MKKFVLLLLFLCFLSTNSLADQMDSYKIGGESGQGNAVYPDWFKQTFFDLSDDLAEAEAAGKRGIIVNFSQKNCNHCEAFVKTTLSNESIKNRITEKYDLIGLDIFSDVEIVLPNGVETTIKNYAEKSRARFTPTLIFYGVEKKPLLKIVGFYPPEKFSNVLDYIDGEHYKKVKLSQYLRSRKELNDAGNIMVNTTIFDKPPVNLEPKNYDGKSFSLVMFESPNCNACKRFHDRVLSDKSIHELMSHYKSVQLDSTNNKDKITLPDGSLSTAQEWSEALQLSYDYSILFFDENGKEVHRIDAECGLSRMNGSLKYVQEKAYEKHEQFLQWRKANRIKEMQSKI